MYIPVDVIAAFNTQGEIRPRYIRIEDGMNHLHTYKIEEVIMRKSQQEGSGAIQIFVCQICIGTCFREILLHYRMNVHRWLLYYPEKA